MKKSTSAFHIKKLRELTVYIQSNLNKDLNVKAISKEFGISFYHLRRIFKFYTNTPLAEYIHNQRIEQAVYLIQHTQQSYNDIAYATGFNDASSLIKSFNREFGITPASLRKNKEMKLNTNVDFLYTQTNIVTSIKSKIIIIPDKKVYFIHYFGNRYSSEYISAWDELRAFAKKNRIVNWKLDAFSIHYDRVKDVGIDNCHTDICISSSNIELPLTGRIQVKKIEGGKYTFFRYKGPRIYTHQIYPLIKKYWLELPNLKFKGLPVIEKYLNSTTSTLPNNLITDIYISIE